MLCYVMLCYVITCRLGSDYRQLPAVCAAERIQDLEIGGGVRHRFLGTKVPYWRPGTRLQKSGDFVPPEAHDFLLILL